MALNVDRETLDEFCVALFRILDTLGILPRQLGWKLDSSGKPQRIAPTELEKYPRLLFGSIQRYNDVNAGFKEWESRLLRDVESPSVRESHYPELEGLRQWMVQHDDVFIKKPNMQHLRTSLYARLFQYLYPRRVLANAYCVRHQGNLNALKQEFLERAMPESMEADLEKLKAVYSAEWVAIIADVKASLIANAAYYDKVLRGKEAVVPPEVVKQTEEKPVEEVSNE